MVGEAAAPHSELNPLRYKVTLQEVVEFRSYRRPIPEGLKKPSDVSNWPMSEPFQREEIQNIGHEPAPPDAIHIDPDGARSLRDFPLRKPDALLTRLLLSRTGNPQVFWMTSWTSHIEAVFFGEIHVRTMDSEEVRAELLKQRELSPSAQSRGLHGRPQQRLGIFAYRGGTRP
jgi:hypothetical protein